MGNGNDSILEAYLFETNSLLEQLDSLVLAAEEKDSFSEEDVNTIFRIMHTIKGSSAMMEYSSLMTIAHRAEDLFAIVRDKSMEIVPEALRPALFAGCRVALGLCWKAGVAAEVIGVVARSVGGKLYDAKAYLEIADLFAWTVVIVAVSALFERVFLFLLGKIFDALEHAV